MAEYLVSSIITDSVMKPMVDSKSIQIIKQSNVPSGEMETYQPFNMALVVGEKDYKNRITQKIVGDDNSITASGVTMIGVMPVPWNETYTVGDKISADDIFEVGSE